MDDIEEACKDMLLRVSTEDAAVDEEIICSEESSVLWVVVDEEDSSAAVDVEAEGRCVVTEDENDCCLDCEDDPCEVAGDDSSCDTLVLTWDMGEDVNPLVIKPDEEENLCIAELEFLTTTVESSILV